MKKNVFTSLAVCCALNFFAQNQGTAVYQMSIDGLPPEQASMMGDMEMKIVWKDNKTYSEQNSMMYSMKSVSDEKETLMLMEMMGNKTYMRINHDDPKYNNKDKELPEYKVEYFNETKKIAGYDCKKALVTMKTKEGKEMTMEVWYTEQVPNVYSQQKYSGKRNQNAAYLKGIKGMPLEYSIPQGEMTVKVTAKEINFNPVSDDAFKLSTEGYKEMKPEDMKRMGGGQ